MLRLIMRGAGLLILIFLLVPAGFSKRAPKRTHKDLKRADDTTTAASSEPTPSSGAAKPAEIAAGEATSTVVPAPPAQSNTNSNKGTNDDYKPNPIFTPMLATTGTIGPVSYTHLTLPTILRV